MPKFSITTLLCRDYRRMRAYHRLDVGMNFRKKNVAQELGQ